jgi:hypothetical protein
MDAPNNCENVNLIEEAKEVIPTVGLDEQR